MTRDDILSRVIELTGVSFDDANDAADQADVDGGDERDFDALVSDCMNALGF